MKALFASIAMAANIVRSSSQGGARGVVGPKISVSRRSFVKLNGARVAINQTLARSQLPTTLSVKAVGLAISDRRQF